MSVRTLSVIRKYGTKIDKPYFITTPIYYVNANPHIGHLYSSVIADAIGRWRIICEGGKIKFSTGTDEHGIKIQQAARNNATNPQEYTDRISLKYRKLADVFSINYTDFIRTTDEKHKEVVAKFWKALVDKDNIYSSKYEGWYCVSDETFLTETQLKECRNEDGKKILVSAESGHPVEWTEETNYVFRLAKYHDQLKNWLRTNENVVRPKVFHKILTDWLSVDHLPDISVSRPISRVPWGIPVPNDATQTIYVWLEALVNYLTVSGYPNSECWPPDVQVIGKDILKFHGIYWPAFLFAAGLEPPRRLFCHSHWTVDGEKMSKSKNNVVCPFLLNEISTSDGLRYFLLREGVAHNDGNYSETKLMRILNAELADTFGNLLNRCCGTVLNPRQKFPSIDVQVFNEISNIDTTRRLLETLHNLPELCKTNYDDFNFYKVVDEVCGCLRAANQFFEYMKPWELRKFENKSKELDVVLHLALETLRITGILLQPIIPNITKRLLDKLNVPEIERFYRNTLKYSFENESFIERNLADEKEKVVLFRRIMDEKKQKTSKG